MAIIALVLANASACAAIPEDTEIDSKSLLPLAAWIEKATHVDMQVMPMVTASNDDLSRALQIENVQQAGAMAAYIPGQIFIRSDKWDATSVKMQSYLVHELVHHAQLISGKTYPCPAAKERAAYQLQNRWLAEKGLPPIATQTWIDAHASCGAAQY